MLALRHLLPVACAAETTGDGITGKTMSDLDIGGDVTVDKGESKQLTATVATVSKSGVLIGEALVVH